LSFLTFLFVRNLQRGRGSGEIYSRSLLIRRSETPINFWITVVVYVTASVFTATCALFSLAMAVFPDKVATLL
jgi:hypothetical protein